MISRNLTWLIGTLSLSFVACSSDGDDPSGPGETSSGGSVGTGGETSSGGTSADGGASSGGQVATTGGSQSGGNSSGGSAPDGGSSSGGAASGGSASGGETSAGGSGSGGETSGSGGGGGGGDVGPGPSDLPPAPTAGDIPRPTGTPGEITVLDWAGFPAAVTYSFDDNDGSQLDYYDQMRALGGRYTYYLVTSNFGVAISDPRWKTIFDDGNEIGNHTTNHSCGADNVAGANTALMNEFGEVPTTLAAPNGDNGCRSDAVGRVFINRDVDNGSPVLPLDNTDPFALNCAIPATGQAAGAYNSDIDSTLSQGGWKIYVIHGIQPTSHTFQPVSWDGLKGAIEYAISNDVWVDTLENVGSYWLGQKVFADAMSSTQDGTTTWTWTLPDKFPPEKYLRVTVEGGTLSQDGSPLTWDPHGYYEIALDQGSVTLSP